jgi:hypothetical protein
MNEIQPHQAACDRLRDMEHLMVNMPQAPCPVVHTFHDGVYMRQVFMPAGTVAIGHHQRFEHINILVQGAVQVRNDDGSLTVLEAPLTFIGQPGRKVGLILSDLVWINVYKTDITDVAEAEDYFLDKSQSVPIPQIAFDHTADKEDYAAMLAEVGVSADTVQEQADDTSDCIPFPSGCYSCGVFDSPIAGKGLFATADFPAGAVIAPARIGGKRTPAGRYINHSATPNAEMVEHGGNIYVIATRDIGGSRATVLGDEITTDYRKNVALVRRLSCQA